MSDNYDGPQMAQKILRQQSEIKKLREIVQVCLDKYIPFREVDLRKSANIACGNPPLEARGLRVHNEDKKGE